MSHFFAEFTTCGSPPCIIRVDTRVYFHSDPNRSQIGNCVGVVWMCNPGSAMWPPAVVPWGPIQGDPTLWRILNLYKAAVGSRTSSVQHGDYIQILNCYYTVDPDSDAAFEEWRQANCTHFESIPASAVFALVAWGTDKPHGPVAKSIKAIQEHCTDPSSKTDPPFLIVYVDPTGPTGPTIILADLERMHFPSHPGSPAFGAVMSAVASALKDHVLGSSGEERVLELDE